MVVFVFVLLIVLINEARAESFFQAEVGLGAVVAGKDIGDDVWQQKKGVPDSEKLTSPAVVVGLVFPLYHAGRWDGLLHLDYTYAGQQSAACMCVSDADYYSGHYNGPRTAFNGFGHVQVVSLTFEPGYTYGGFRFSVEAGPSAVWATWHEAAGGGNYNHKTSTQFGWVMGAGVERGRWGLHYRYYQVREAWNPNPGLVTGLHMLYLSYRF